MRRTLDQTLISPREAARRCGVSLKTIRRWAAAGLFDSVKVGHLRRVVLESLEDWILGEAEARRQREQILQMPRPSKRQRQRQAEADERWLEARGY